MDEMIETPDYLKEIQNFDRNKVPQLTGPLKMLWYDNWYDGPLDGVALHRGVHYYFFTHEIPENSPPIFLAFRLRDEELKGESTKQYSQKLWQQKWQGKTDSAEAKAEYELQFGTVWEEPEFLRVDRVTAWFSEQDMH
jgi:hypothetical protein